MNDPCQSVFQSRQVRYSGYGGSAVGSGTKRGEERLHGSYKIEIIDTCKHGSGARMNDSTLMRRTMGDMSKTAWILLERDFRPKH